MVAKKKPKQGTMKLPEGAVLVAMDENVAAVRETYPGVRVMSLSEAPRKLRGMGMAPKGGELVLSLLGDIPRDDPGVVAATACADRFGWKVTW